MRGEDFLRLMYPETQIGRALEALHTAGVASHFKQERFRPRTLAMHVLAAARHVTRARDLSRIRCPTLLLTGAEDVLIPPVNSQRIAARIPGAKLRVLPEVGHDILTLAPNTVSELVQWLSAPDRERAAS